MSLLRFTLLASSLAALAATGSPHRSCAPALSGDERLAALNEISPETPAVVVARARLLNEAWWPVMVKARDIVTHLRDEELTRIRREWISAIDPVKGEIKEAPERRLQIAREAGFVYDRAYDEVWWINLNKLGMSEILGFKIPFTPANRDFMRRVGVTTAVLSLLFRERRAELRAAFPRENRCVLEEHSFTEAWADRGLYYAMETFNQVFALVTASAIDGLTPEDLARRASESSRGVSVIERLALLFPPTLFGHFGAKLYFAGAVEIGERGRVILSDRMLRAVRELRETWASHGQRSPHEFGFGCPVAYPSPREGARTGVGLALEAFLHLYDRL